LGVAESQVDELVRRGRALQVVTYYAPADGVVATLNAPEGMFVKPEMEVMSIADLASVWVYAEVFEQQAGWVAVGQPAEVRLAYQPDRIWEGEVEYVYPDLAPQTRTLRVRLRFPNPDEQLKPNMYAEVTIFGGAREDIVVIPREALIRTGRGERVILALGGGRFVPRQVVSGMESGDFVEIAAGLEAGETVVVSGQFLIDSEASLKSSLRRMQGLPAPSAAAAEELAAKRDRITGTGILRSLLPEQFKVNIQHDPIEALGWPAMTMDFALAPDVSLDGLAPGDAVEFELSDQADGFRIRGLRRQEPEETSP
jgi:Cu(I)/Ag(I) efflux system membrane fusion protein